MPSVRHDVERRQPRQHALIALFLLLEHPLGKGEQVVRHRRNPLLLAHRSVGDARLDARNVDRLAEILRSCRHLLSDADERPPLRILLELFDMLRQVCRSERRIAQPRHERDAADLREFAPRFQLLDEARQFNGLALFRHGEHRAVDDAVRLAVEVARTEDARKLVNLVRLREDRAQHFRLDFRTRELSQIRQKCHRCLLPNARTAPRSFAPTPRRTPSGRRG